VSRYCEPIGVARGCGGAGALPKAEIPSKFAQIVGIRSCCYTYFALKMHRNIPFVDERTHFFPGDGLPLP